MKSTRFDNVAVGHAFIYENKSFVKMPLDRCVGTSGREMVTYNARQMPKNHLWLFANDDMVMSLDKDAK